MNSFMEIRKCGSAFIYVLYALQFSQFLYKNCVRESWLTPEKLIMSLDYIVSFSRSLFLERGEETIK